MTFNGTYSLLHNSVDKHLKRVGKYEKAGNKSFKINKYAQCV